MGGAELSGAELERILREDFGLTDAEVAAELGRGDRRRRSTVEPELPWQEAALRDRLRRESRRHEERLERDLADDPRSWRPAPAARAAARLTWAAKVMRLAKAMAQLRGLEWWQTSERGKRELVALARFALDALELVERDEEVLASPKTKAAESRFSSGTN